MSERHRGKTPPSGPRHLQAVPDPETPASPDEFFKSIAEALDDPEPLMFLSLASTIVSALDPRSITLFAGHGDGPDASTLVDMFMAHQSSETTALLFAVAALVPDDDLAQRAGTEARRREHSVPHWLSQLQDAAPGPAVAARDVLGDGENAIVSVQLAGGLSLTGVVYIDHNFGSIAKDGFVLPGDVDEFRRHFEALSDDLDELSFGELEPADARARISHAIDEGAMAVPPLESETWPACRPLLEWMVGLLPAGGTDFAFPEITDEQLSGAVREFISSPQAKSLGGSDDAEIAGDLLSFTTDHTGGDPLRWSPANVELLLVGWYPHTIQADDDYLLRMPTVLRALVRYAHEQRGVPDHLTGQTLSAVDIWEPEYIDLVGSGGEAHGLITANDVLAHLGGFWIDHAAGAVGGDEALAALDDAPLPDEPFVWDGIPEDIRSRVTTVLELCDACAEELFDLEMRTAFRRVLAQTAATDPAVFRRKSKDTTAAAAIAWAVAKSNGRLDPSSGGLTAKELAAHFGVRGSVSTRARPFLRAFGAPEDQWAGDITLGTPDVLTAERRAELIRIRDEDD